MSRALAIDMFCGLVLKQAKLRSREDAFIKQPMACWAQHPEHVRAAILHFPPDAFAAMFGSMCKFNDSGFSARLTRSWQIWELAAHSRDDTGVFVFPSRVVSLLGIRIAAMKRSALFSSCLLRAVVGAIATVTVRPHDRKVLRADPTQLSVLRFVRLLLPPQSSCTRRASDRTKPLVWTLRMEATATA